MVRDLFNELGLGVYTPSPEVLQGQQQLFNLSQQIANTQAALDAEKEAKQQALIQPQQPLTQDSSGQVGLIPNTLQKAQQFGDDVIINARELYSQPRGGNIFKNAIYDLGEISTGLTGMAVHPMETLESLGGYITDTSRAYKHPEHPILGSVKEVGNDIVNLLVSTYGISTHDGAEVVNKVMSGDIKGATEKFGSDIVTTIVNAYKHPAITAMDITPFFLAGKSGKIAEVATKGRSGAVNTAIDSSASKAISKTYKVQEAMQDINKEIKKPIGGAYKAGDLTNAIRNLEEGAIASTEAEKAATKALSKAVDAWNESIPEAYKVDNFTVAHNQRMVRTGKATSLVDADKYTQQFAKSRGTATDLSEEALKNRKGKIGEKAQVGKVEYDWDAIRKAAGAGDEWAKEMLISKQSFDKGYLKLVPHGLAEVAKDAAGKSLSGAERIFAGKYSTRVFGTATYEDIADQIKNANEWLDKQIQHFTEAEIAREILEEGTIGGQKLVLEGANPKDIVYLDREALVEKDLSKALDRALPTQTPNTIPIEKQLVKELVDQFKVRSDKPFGARWMNEGYQTSKQNMLAAASYLVGNAVTGANNAIMNSGLNPVTFARDIIDASRTKGRLAKEMGIYRQLGKSTVTAKTPVFKGVQKFNAPVADTLNYIDAKMQNTFAEMAAHNRLRSQGVNFENRANTLMNMDKVKLAQSIHDARMMALLNPNRTIAPKFLHGALSIFNPFWRWWDTATQSSAYMMAKHPFVNNLVLNEFGARIGYDQEMQRRLKLNVLSDKQGVSYRYNPDSRKLEEVSCEFIPQLATMKLLVDTEEAMRTGNPDDLPFKISSSSAPLFGAILNATYGKDKYGKPLLRPEADRRVNGAIQVMQGNRRYHFVPNQTIGFEEIKGGMGDEILSTAINELIAYPKLFNRMVLPAAAAGSNLLTGSNLRYYKPYPNQIIGEISQAGQMPEYANPRSSAAGQELMDIMTGKFARTYDPMMEMRNEMPLNPQTQKQLMRGFGQRLGRDSMILGGQ